MNFCPVHTANDRHVKRVARDNLRGRSLIKLEWLADESKRSENFYARCVSSITSLPIATFSRVARALMREKISQQFRVVEVIYNT